MEPIVQVLLQLVLHQKIFDYFYTFSSRNAYQFENLYAQLTILIILFIQKFLIEHILKILIHVYLHINIPTLKFILQIMIHS